MFFWFTYCLNLGLQHVVYLRQNWQNSWGVFWVNHSLYNLWNNKGGPHIYSLCYFGKLEFIYPESSFMRKFYSFPLLLYCTYNRNWCRTGYIQNHSELLIYYNWMEINHHTMKTHSLICMLPAALNLRSITCSEPWRRSYYSLSKEKSINYTLPFKRH